MPRHVRGEGTKTPRRFGRRGEFKVQEMDLCYWNTISYSV